MSRQPREGPPSPQIPETLDERCQEETNDGLNPDRIFQGTIPGGLIFVANQVKGFVINMVESVEPLLKRTKTLFHYGQNGNSNTPPPTPA